jgi:hypothetical protein
MTQGTVSAMTTDTSTSTITRPLPTHIVTSTSSIAPTPTTSTSTSTSVGRLDAAADACCPLCRRALSGRSLLGTDCRGVKTEIVIAVVIVRLCVFVRDCSMLRALSLSLSLLSFSSSTRYVEASAHVDRCLLSFDGGVAQPPNATTAATLSSPSSSSSTVSRKRKEAPTVNQQKGSMDTFVNKFRK